MADIQPKNTDTIRVNTIKEKTAASGITFGHTLKADTIAEATGSAKTSFSNGIKSDTIAEKTASAGVTVNGILNFVTGGTYYVDPQNATVDLGTSTATHHFANAFIKSIKAAAAMLLGTTSANDLQIQTNGTVRETFKSGGTVLRRYGHTGYTAGGEIRDGTGAANCNSATPVTMYTYTIEAGNTQVAVFFDILSRDQSTGNQGRESGFFSCSRAGAGAVAGSVTTDHQTGTNLVDTTILASGNDILFKVNNNSGSNTISTVGYFRAIPVSTE